MSPSRPKPQGLAITMHSSMSDISKVEWNGSWRVPVFYETGVLLLAGSKMRPGMFEHDSLTTLDTLDALDTADRADFRAGSTNTRRYTIDFGPDGTNWLIFNYAIDACWGLIPGFDPGGAPPVAPDDFPMTANCPEPYRPIELPPHSFSMAASLVAMISSASS